MSSSKPQSTDVQFQVYGHGENSVIVASLGYASAAASFYELVEGVGMGQPLIDRLRAVVGSLTSTQADAVTNAVDRFGTAINEQIKGETSKPEILVKLPESDAMWDWDWVRIIYGSRPLDVATYRGGHYLQGIRESLGPDFAAFEAECKAKNVDMESLYPVKTDAAEDDNEIVTCTVTFQYKEMP